MHRFLLLTCAIVTLGAAEVPAATPNNLVSNGDFSAGEQDWKLSDKAEIRALDTNKYLHLNVPTLVMYTKDIAIDPSWKTLTTSVRMQVKGFKQGPEAWSMVRVAASFLGADGHASYPGMAQKSGDTAGWEKVEVTQQIPAGAVQYKVQLANFGAAGEVDFDDLVITAH